MRLLSLTVRNYRIHRDRTVTFAEGLNLLGGPNEVGKSTLAEALHRAFFLRANVTGSARDAMLSRPARGHPEVEVRFTAQGEEWTVRKTFSGQSGTTQLSRAGETTLAGDEAEARLAELLAGEEAVGGRQAGQLDGKWGHLWVRQGRSDDDPAGGLQARAEQLMTRLQSMGGAGLYVSDRDSRAAAEVAERYEAIFTKAGNPRSASDLAAREQEVADSEEESGRRAEAVAELEGAAERYRTAGDRIEAAGKALAELEAEWKSVEARLKETGELERKLETQTTGLEGTRTQLDKARAADRDIAALRREIETLEAGMAPRRAEVEALQADRLARAEAHQARAREAEEAAAANRSARAELESTRALERWVERRAAAAELEEAREQIEALEAEAQEVTRQMSELPPVTEEVLDELRALEDRRVRAEERLRAIAAEIEVLAADQAVSWDDEPLAEGTPRTVTEGGELRVGEGTRIRIRPGGGQTLAEERAQAGALAAELVRSLEACGCASFGEALEALKERARLEGRRGQLRSKLDVLSGSDFEARMRRAREELTEAEGALGRFGQDPTEAPRDPDEIHERLRSAQSRVAECEAAESTLRADVEGLARRLTDAEKALEAGRETLRTRESELDRMTSKVEVLESQAGDAEARVRVIRDLERREETEAGACASTREALEALDPPQLEADRVRLERALTHQREERSQADRDRAAAGALLESNGSMDPYADLKAANAALDAARERESAARLRADAVKLLHELFESEKEALTRSLAAPLEERVNQYLQAIFQDGSEIALSLDGTRFTTPALRREERFDFGELSRGAREQFAAAVRLAVAEVLAEEHGGSLPVIFDDAFTHSDEWRVRGLIRALDLAAQRGLQVVLITCAPDDYVALGATLVRVEDTQLQAHSGR